MKNKALNTLNYTGIVTLSQYIGTKKVKVAQVHNTGNTSLFSFLANCLAGEFDKAKVDIPNKIMILRRSTTSDGFSYTSVDNSFIPLRTPPVPAYTAGESKVRFSFIIPKDFLDSLKQSSSQDNVTGLGLYAKSAKSADNFMAFCALSDLDQNIQTNAYLVVDWELIISNITKS